MRNSGSWATALALLAMLSLSGVAGAATPTAPRAFPPNTPEELLPVGVSWGTNTAGQLGDGTTKKRLTPVILGNGSGLDTEEIAALDVGDTHTCGLATFQVYCWGDNSRGQLGISTVGGSHPQPAAVGVGLAGHTATGVSAGSAHTCAVASNHAYCWGGNENGELGTGNLQDSDVAVKVGGVLTGKVVTAISAGYYHSCAIAEGHAYCWGRNVEGQLGIGPGDSSPVPIQVTGGDLGSKVVDSIAVGGYHTCALAEGHAYCWGRNNRGQLGTGSDKDSALPAAVATDGLLNGAILATSIAAGGDDSCAVATTKASRTAVCWGFGVNGELGDGGHQDRQTPVAVNTAGPLAGRNIESLSISDGGGCAIAAGQGYCWGDNVKSGRLGTVTNMPSSVPVPVDTTGSLKGRVLTGISTGFSHTAAVAVSAPFFTDVPSAYPFYNDITWVAGTGIALGYQDKTYGPTSNVSKQAMAAFIYRFANRSVGDEGCDPDAPRAFTDVPVSSPFCGAVEWLVLAGIVTGGGKFDPGSTLSRGTMATWIFHTLHPAVPAQPCGGVTFDDVTAAIPACGDIEWLARTGITTGYNDQTFLPNAPIHRDAMAAFFHRADALASH